VVSVREQKEPSRPHKIPHKIQCELQLELNIAHAPSEIEHDHKVAVFPQSLEGISLVESDRVRVRA
jgi:hypothetical protein